MTNYKKFLIGLGRLRTFVARERTTLVPRGHMEGDINLSNWVNYQKINRVTLTDQRISDLESVPGWTWKKQKASRSVKSVGTRGVPVGSKDKPNPHRRFAKVGFYRPSDAEIIAQLERGYSHAAVGVWAGLTRGRIGQIAKDLGYRVPKGALPVQDDLPPLLPRAEPHQPAIEAEEIRALRDMVRSLTDALAEQSARNDELLEIVKHLLAGDAMDLARGLWGRRYMSAEDVEREVLMQTSVEIPVWVLTNILGRKPSKEANADAR